MPYSDIQAQRDYQRRWMADRRQKALAGKTCAYCGSDADLHFHHFDPFEKTTHRVWSWTADRREQELAKCIVLCRGCHIVHHREHRSPFCKRGHELTEENSYWKPGRTTRECRTCRRDRRGRVAA